MVRVQLADPHGSYRLIMSFNMPPKYPRVKHAVLLAEDQPQQTRDGIVDHPALERE
jgi:hypothetical protein